MTGLAGRSEARDEFRLACYRAAREQLFAAGYDQLSLRLFSKQDARSRNRRQSCAREDGTVGLGCGARSYTQPLHYSTEYAVGRSGILEILKDYIARPRTAFETVDYGIAVDEHEQRRRFLLLSLMSCAGLDRKAYTKRFGGDAIDDFPELMALARRGLATLGERAIVLTPDGLERSDAIGPWLYSTEVRQRMESYAWR